MEEDKKENSNNLNEDIQKIHDKIDNLQKVFDNFIDKDKRTIEIFSENKKENELKTPIENKKDIFGRSIEKDKNNG